MKCNTCTSVKALLAILCVCVISGCMKSPTPMPRETLKAVSPADAQMSAVLRQLQLLDPKPIEKLSADDARKQPTMTDAVMAEIKAENKSVMPDPVADVDNRTISMRGKSVDVRVYTPEGKGPFPVIVYAHGGGWVIATLDTYDASTRALNNLTHSVVVSVDYKQAPDYKFPSAHEDVYLATQWVFENAKKINGDPKRIAIAGESAGGNIASAVTLMAKDRHGHMPIHQVLIYPVTNYAFNTASYQENEFAKPLNKAMMQWFFEKYAPSSSDTNNKYLSLMKASNSDLKGLPPATIVTAQIDPLMSEGKAYADKLSASGVDVAYQNFNGVTHEFFGAAKVLDKAGDAQKFVAVRLANAFAK